MATYIGEASKDENGNLWGGQDGDQNGLEVRVTPWFAQTRDGRRWDWVARIRNRPDVAQAFAILMIESCNNSNVGYNQHLPFLFLLNALGLGSFLREEGV